MLCAAGCDDLRGDGPKRCIGGRFDLLDRVGVGGGAVVVRARDRQLHRLVAVKWPKPHAFIEEGEPHPSAAARPHCPLHAARLAALGRTQVPVPVRDLNMDLVRGEVDAGPVEREATPT